MTAVNAGRDLVAQDSSEPSGEIRIPTLRNEFRNLETLAGSVESTFTLFKTGSSSVSLEGDPPYDVGQRYVLFIAPRNEGDGTYLPVGPDGRLREGSDGRIHALIKGPVGNALDGKSTAEVKAAVRE